MKRMKTTDGENSNVREANTDNERDLCTATLLKDVEKLTSLLHNVHDDVCQHEKKRERECEEVREEDEGGE